MNGSACAAILELLDSYLSNELLVETNHRIMSHVAECRGCAEELARRRQLRLVLREALPAGPDPAPVEQRLLTELARRPARSPLSAGRLGLLAAAATLAVVAGSWWWVAPRQPSGEVDPVTSISPVVLPVAYRDSIDNHKECALALPLPEELTAGRVAIRFDAAYRGLIDVVATAAAPYRVADAHDCRHNESEFRHLVLRGDGHIVSVMALRGPSHGAPPGARLLSVEQSREPVWQFRDAGFETAALESAGHLAVVVSDLDPDTHQRLALRVLPTMARALELVRARE